MRRSKSDLARCARPIWPWVGLAALAAAALLAGCSKPAANATNTAAVNAAPADTIIAAAQFPAPKLGYWEETVVDNGGAPRVTYDCVRNNTLSLDDFIQGCSTVTVKHLASGDYTVDVKCLDDSSGTTRVGHAVLHGDVNSSFSLSTSEQHTTPGEATTTDTHRVDAHYAGPCPTD